MAYSSEDEERILKFGISEEEMNLMNSYNGIFPINLLLAHIAHLEVKSVKLVDGLERIASGMLTQGESKDQAQFSLESATLRDWRSNTNDKKD